MAHANRSLGSPMVGTASLHSSPTATSASQRPQSDRADDMLPKGTVFRWNPYVSTPTSTTHASGGLGAGAEVVGGPALTPHHNAPPGGSPSANAQRNKLLQARGAPIDVISPRADVAAADCLSTPLADGDAPTGALSPGGENSGFVSYVAATVDPATGEPLPRRTVELSANVALVSDANDPIERTMVALIEEQRDAEVRARVLALPQREANLLYRHLVRNTALSEYLCFKQRGKIFADVIEASAEALNNADLFRWMQNDLQRFVLDQSGCIAVTRVYDVVPAALRATIDDYVALNFVDLATHPFGNYAVQRVIQAADPDIVASLARQLKSRGVIASLTTSKAGSHVVERFVTKVPLAAALPVCRVLLTADPALVTSLAHDRYGNYVLQASLRKVFDTKKALADPTDGGSSNTSEAAAMTPELKADVAALADTCLVDVPPLVASSPHNANIQRAMGVKVVKADSSKSSPVIAGGAPPAGSSAGSPPQQGSPQQQGTAGAKPKGPRLSASALRRGVRR